MLNYMLCRLIASSVRTLEARIGTSKDVSQYGEMTAGEMLASWIAHDNLHIRQLVDLRRLRIEKITRPCSIGYAGDW